MEIKKLGIDTKELKQLTINGKCFIGIFTPNDKDGGELSHSIRVAEGNSLEQCMRQWYRAYLTEELHASSFKGQITVQVGDFTSEQLEDIEYTFLKCKREADKAVPNLKAAAIK